MCYNILYKDETGGHNLEEKNDMAQEKLLSLHDIVSVGATVVINGKKHILDEVMMI